MTLNESDDLPMDGAPKKIKLAGSNIFRKSTQGEGEAPKIGPIKAGRLSIKKSDVKLKFDN